MTRQTLQNMIDDLARIDGELFGGIRPDGDLLVYGEETEVNHAITPNDRGEYVLWELGWTFLA